MGYNSSSLPRPMEMWASLEANNPGLLFLPLESQSNVPASFLLEGKRDFPSVLSGSVARA